MTDNLFQQQDQPLIDPNKDYYPELVGPDQKFKDNAALARAKMESDLYIKTLERQKDEMREDLMKYRDESTSRARLEDLIDQLSKLQNQSSASNEQNQNVNENKQPSINLEDIDKRFAETIQKHELAKKQQENMQFVEKKLREHFGDNYQNALKSQVDTLGLDQDFVNDLAKNRPQVLLRSLGVDLPRQPENFQTPPRSTQRSDPFAPTVTKRTFAYYEKMKKENPKQYDDPKTQVQMHEDYKNLGKEFEDGNFNRY